MPGRGDEESDAASVTAVLVDMIERLWAAHVVEPIGGGAAGIVEWPAGTMLWALSNAYRDRPVREQPEKVTDLAVVVDSDADVAAQAEARLGEASRTWRWSPW